MWLEVGLLGLTAGVVPPPLQGHAHGPTRVHIGGECGAHAVLAPLTETRVVQASLGRSSSQNDVSYMIIVCLYYVLCSMTSFWCMSIIMSYNFVNRWVNLWMTRSENTVGVGQQGTPVIGVSLYRKKEHNMRLTTLEWLKAEAKSFTPALGSTGEVVYLWEYRWGGLPLSTLRLQGLLIRLVTSGQLGWALHVLAYVAAVPAIIPLVVLKSSASTSLKSPHKPG
jgi:hypothetical protein